MSVTLEKLRALRSQAGLTEAIARDAAGSTAVPLCSPTAGVARGGAPVQWAHVPALDTPPVESLRGERGGVTHANSTLVPPRATANPLHAPRQGVSATAPDPIASLRRMLRGRSRGPVSEVPRAPLDRSLPGVELAPGLRLIANHLPFPAPDVALSLAFAKRDGESVDPRALLFFDTETTGLAGGTGTRAFMIGAADWHRDPIHGDGLRVRQLLITTLAAEASMLRTFAGWLSPDTALSSYNGRCYDSPLLKTRYRLARLPDPITPLDHIDLLFPTRRRYRGVWENCRLATIERELLQIVREDDLPGSEAPAAWRSFLRGGSSRNVCRVAAHNHQDVVTLARLMIRLVEADAAQASTAVFT